MGISRAQTIRIAAVAIVAAVAGGMLGCAPQPEPTPTPTAAFASEEEAFAAAEEVYRAYNDAGNARRAGDQSPDPQDFLTGTALEGDIDSINLLRDQGVRVVGAVGIVWIDGTNARYDEPEAKITATVCLDATDTRVIDENGNDVTPSDREPLLAQTVTFIGHASALLISAETATSEPECG